MKSTTKYTSAGRAFDVSLVLIISEKSKVSANMMDKVESTRHDFIVRCADGEQLLVRSAEMAYKCVAEEEFAEGLEEYNEGLAEFNDAKAEAETEIENKPS